MAVLFPPQLLRKVHVIDPQARGGLLKVAHALLVQYVQPLMLVPP